MIANQFDAMRAAVREAQDTLRAADEMARDMARLLRGRLRNVPPGLLRDLKRELTAFNAHTGDWKS